MTTWRKVLNYWTETKRIVGGEVKQTVCCCGSPGARPKECAYLSKPRRKTPCRCDCHRGQTGPAPEVSHDAE